VIDNIAIAGGVKTGGGTVVIKNLTNKGLYVGNPARYIK
jgi:serine acetyltransferase